MNVPEKRGTPAQGKGWTAYCDKCGGKFDSEDAVKVSYQEYSGASTSYEEVSPCCGTDYNDVPPKEVSEE